MTNTHQVAQIFEECGLDGVGQLPLNIQDICGFELIASMPGPRSENLKVESRRRHSSSPANMVNSPPKGFLRK